MSKFMAASRQATELDKERIKMEMKIRDMEKEASHKARERAKLEDEVKDLKNPIEELNHLLKQNDEFKSSLSKAKDKATK